MPTTADNADPTDTEDTNPFTTNPSDNPSEDLSEDPGGEEGPLRGLVVIDAASIIAGPLAGALFKMFGARVIKLELPDVGDTVRTMGPPGAETSIWSFLTQDKECISCRLSHPLGADLLKQMITKADVLIESFRPGTMEKWGIGPEDLHAINPNLTIVRISGFGQDGPYKNRPGYGTLAEAMAGFAHVTGEPDGPPTLPGFPVADTITGMLAAITTLTTLLSNHLHPPTRGHVLDINLYESLTYFLTPLLLEYQMLGTPPERRGNRAFGTNPRNAARCADNKWVAYSIQSTPLLTKLITFLNLTHDPRFTTTTQLRDHGEDLDQILLTWIAQRDRTQVLKELINADIPVAPINDAADILNDEHLHHRGDLINIPNTPTTQLTLLNPPTRINGWRRHPHATGFTIGQHNTNIYQNWLGLTPQQIQHLTNNNAI